MSGSDLWPMVWWFLAGAGVEVLNTLSRRWSVNWALSPSGLRTLAAAVMVVGLVVRVGLTGLVLALAFRQSALCGAAALLGYWLSRGAAVWWLHRSAQRQKGHSKAGDTWDR